MDGCSVNDGAQGGMEEFCSWPPHEGIRCQAKEDLELKTVTDIYFASH